MIEVLKRHWPEYFMEAGGLMFFMVNAAWLTTLLEYPGSPIRRAINSDFLRRIPLGIAMGLVIAAIVYSKWGKRSGAHINPAVTCAFLRLGKIGKWDAAFYILFQFLGGIAAAFSMRLLLGAPFQNEKVMFATTQPGMTTGAGVAFAAEFAITFILMSALLLSMSSKMFHEKTGWIAAVLVSIFLWFETPLSGMSLNPARSFGSALAGNIWNSLWVYFVAPPAATLLAAEVFLRWKGAASINSANLGNSSSAEFLHDNQKLPAFPSVEEGAKPVKSDKKPKPSVTV